MAALALQGLLSMVIVLVAGSFVDTILYSAPAVWLFFLATGLSLFRLRKKEASIPRPFKAPLYPVVPILFCAACVFMLFSSASYAFAEKPVGLLALLSVMAASALFWRKADGTHFGS